MPCSIWRGKGPQVIRQKSNKKKALVGPVWEKEEMGASTGADAAAAWAGDMSGMLFEDHVVWLGVRLEHDPHVRFEVHVLSFLSFSARNRLRVGHFLLPK